jgi:hypothetical protein
MEARVADSVPFLAFSCLSLDPVLPAVYNRWHDPRGVYKAPCITVTFTRKHFKPLVLSRFKEDSVLRFRYTHSFNSYLLDACCVPLGHVRE